MANDYMAKLAADLESMSMMRSPKPMTVVYRDAGGDLGGFDYDLSEAADIAGYESFDGTGGANTQGNMTGVDAEAYKQAAIADPNLPTGDEFDPSTPASEGGYPQIVADNLRREKLEFEDLQFIIEAAKNAPPGTKFYMPNIPLYNQKNRVALDVITKQDRKSAPDVPYPTDIDNKIDYDALFDRYATPEEKNRETQPPTGEELMDRHNEFFNQELMGLKNNMTRGFSDDPDMRLLADGSLFDGKAEGGAIPTIYRDMGGDIDYDYDLEEAADIAIDEGFNITGDAGSETGAQTPEEQQYNLPPGTLDPVTGVGTERGPGEFSGGPDDRASTIDALDRIFNKEGIPQEFVPYFNSLKDRGLSNEQAMATLAAVAGTPGGAQGLTSGYTDGYSFGGPMGTLEDLIETGQTASLEERAKKAREKQEAKEKEKDEEGVAPASLADYEEPGFMDRFASILGLDDFSLASLNPFSTTVTPQQQAIFDSLSAQGLTVQERSPMDYALGFIGSSILPTELGIGKFALERATDTNIIGLATDPATGFEYLVEAGGGLQLAPGQLGDEFNQDGGNEPAITKKRKAATEPVEEKDITKDVNKPSFPQQSLPRFTKGAIENLKISLKDDPEKLAQILQNYSIPDEYSGLRTLV